MSLALNAFFLGVGCVYIARWSRRQGDASGRVVAIVLAVAYFLAAGAIAVSRVVA